MAQQTYTHRWTIPLGSKRVRIVVWPTRQRLARAVAGRGAQPSHRFQQRLIGATLRLVERRKGRITPLIAEIHLAETYLRVDVIAHEVLHAVFHYFSVLEFSAVAFGHHETTNIVRHGRRVSMRVKHVHLEEQLASRVGWLTQRIVQDLLSFGCTLRIPKRH